MIRGKVPLDGETPLLVCVKVNADAICSVFIKTGELGLGRQRVGQVSGLANIDTFMRHPTKRAACVFAFGDEKDGAD